MPENAPGFTQANTNIPPYNLLGGPENIKLLFDEELDDRRTYRSFAQGWETLRLSQAQNLAALSHFVNMGTALAGQIGVTEGQQSVSPIRTGAADTEVQMPAGSVYPPIRNVDQSSATANGVIQTSMAQVAANIAALQDVVVKLAEALAPVIIAAAGSATNNAPKS